MTSSSRTRSRGVHGLIASVLERDPTSTAFVSQEFQVSLAAHLAAAEDVVGLHRGHYAMAGDDVFAVYADATVRYATLWLSAPLGAGMICPINTRLDLIEVAAILRDCSPRVIYVDEAHQRRLEKAVNMSGVTCRIVAIDKPVVANGGERSTRVEPNQPIAIVYTGGSTGSPRGVVHTGDSIAAFVDHWDQILPADEGLRYVQLGNMYHIGGALGSVAIPAIGATSVIRAGFRADDLIADVEQLGVTDLVLVPTSLRMLADRVRETGKRLQTLRRISYGGAPMPTEVLAEVIAAFPNAEFMQTYGSTEVPVLTAFQQQTSAPGPHQKLSVGKPLVGVSLRIDPLGEPGTDESGGGRVGEIVASSPTQMAGYFPLPPAGERGADGRPTSWVQEVRTGDVGYIDDDGAVFIVGRVKDMIISGGENIFAGEIEAAILPHDLVDDVAVVGVPDAKWGEVPHAFVCAAHGTTGLSLDDINEFARRSGLASYKLPRSLTIVDEPLPLTPIGKVDKPALKRTLERAAP